MPSRGTASIRVSLYPHFVMQDLGGSLRAIVNGASPRIKIRKGVGGVGEGVDLIEARSERDG